MILMGRANAAVLPHQPVEILESIWIVNTSFVSCHCMYMLCTNRALGGESRKIVESHEYQKLRLVIEKKSDKNGRSRARDREMDTNTITEGNENQVADKV